MIVHCHANDRSARIKVPGGHRQPSGRDWGGQPGPSDMAVLARGRKNARHAGGGPAASRAAAEILTSFTQARAQPTRRERREQLHLVDGHECRERIE
jgi:hypothetical protein